MLKKILEIHKDFCELYGSEKSGLIGISDSHVQLDGEAFKRLFKDEDIKTEWNGLSIEVSIIYEKVKFIALI